MMFLNSSSETLSLFFHAVFCQIKLKEIFETPAEISLVLELVTGGELFDRSVHHGGKVLQANNG